MRTVQEAVSRGSLTRNAICEAALLIIDTDGLPAVSMRGLASALGVKAGSLYHHFRSKEELLAECAELLYQETGPLPSGGNWKDQVCAIFVQLADLVEMHPQAAPLLIGNLARSRSARERARAIAVAVGASGLSPEGRASLLSNLAALLAGHSVLSVWASGSVDAPRLKGPDAGQAFPAVGTQVRLMGQEFEAGMAALIDGFVRGESGEGF